MDKLGTYRNFETLRNAGWRTIVDRLDIRQYHAHATRLIEGSTEEEKIEAFGPTVRDSVQNLVHVAQTHDSCQKTTVKFGNAIGRAA